MNESKPNILKLGATSSIDAKVAQTPLPYYRMDLRFKRMGAWIKIAG
jgi:hypothetical protein